MDMRPMMQCGAHGGLHDMGGSATLCSFLCDAKGKILAQCQAQQARPGEARRGKALLVGAQVTWRHA
jgi:hypothetical protein